MLREVQISHRTRARKRHIAVALETTTNMRAVACQANTVASYDSLHPTVKPVIAAPCKLSTARSFGRSCIFSFRQL